MARFRLTAFLAALSAIVAGATVFTAGPAFAEDGDYLTSQALRDRAIAAFTAKVGGDPQLLWAEIQPAAIVLWTQSAQSPELTDRWSIERDKTLLSDGERISGPTPVAGDTRVAASAENFFPLSSIATGKLDIIISRAADFSGMGGRPTVSDITIQREFIPVGGWHLGDPRIEVALQTPRESAIVYADLKGEIIGGNLDKTLRVMNLDMLAQDDWPAGEVQVLLAQATGPGSVLRSLNVSRYFVSVDYEPTAGAPLQHSTWTYGGVTRGEDSVNDTSAHPEQLNFAWSDLDLRAVPAIKAAALKAAGVDGVKISHLEARKIDGQIPQLLWFADLELPNGNKGLVSLNAKGEVVDADAMSSATTPSR